MQGWAHTNNERRFQRRLKEREAILGLLRLTLHHRKTLPDSERLARQGFEHADTDPILYAETFGEPLPEHWRQAIRYETDTWAALITTLQELRTRPAAAYNEHRKDLRTEAQRITRLIELEQHMLRSPLTKHFERAMEHLA
jgi:hypothetical protein